MCPLRWLGAAAFVVPGVAFATITDGNLLDLRGGPVGELTAKSLALAHGLLAFLLVLSLVVELLRGPSQRRRYLAVVWRTLLVLALLQAYPFLAGTVVKQFTSLAESLSSPDLAGVPLDTYRSAVAHSLTASAPPRAGAATPVALGSPVASQGPVEPESTISGFLFDALLGLIFLVAFSTNWVFTQLSSILISFFYVIGPLALVFYVPGLDAPTRWFRSLVTVSCWPVVSCVLLHLASAVLGQASLVAGAEATFYGIASSLLLCVLALATPKIASALVGGVGNLIAEGAAVVLR